MARYQYRHQLDMDEHYPELDARGRLVLETAFDIARRIHLHQSRKKIDPAIGYISHPIMVCDIMYGCGERDPAVLAAALLHDAIEHDQYYINHPRRLESEFAMRADAHRDSALWSHEEITALAQHVNDLCREVTNPEVFPDTKENVQIDRVAQMSFAAKKIKIADQMASLICNLTMANDIKQFPIKKEKEFTNKAYSLVVAIVASVADTPLEARALEPLTSMFGRVYLRAQRLFPTPPKPIAELQTYRETVRDKFDYQEVLNDPTTIAIIPPAVAIAAGLDFEPTSAPPKGLSHIDFDQQGKVVSCILWKDKGLQEKLSAQLRAMQQRANPYTGDMDKVIKGILQPGESDMLDGHPRRIYYLSPPLDAGAFCGAVRMTDSRGPDITPKIGEAVLQRIMSRSEELRTAFEKTLQDARTAGTVARKFPSGLDGPRSDRDPFAR